MFLRPDSHPRGTFHPEMRSVLFPAAAPCERWNHQEAVDWKKKANKKKIKKPSQRAASNKSEVPPAGVSPSPIRELRLTSPPQCLVNK